MSPEHNVGDGNQNTMIEFVGADKTCAMRQRVFYEREIEYTYVDSNTLLEQLAPEKYYQWVSMHSDISALKKLVAEKHGVREKELFVCDVREGKIYRRLENYDLIKYIGEEAQLFIYHSARRDRQKREGRWSRETYTMVAVCQTYGDRRSHRQTNGDRRRHRGLRKRRHRSATATNGDQLRKFARWSHDPNNYKALGYPLLLRLKCYWKTPMRHIRAQLWQLARHFLKSTTLTVEDELPFRLFAQRGRRGSSQVEIVDSDKTISVDEYELRFCIHWDDVHQFVHHKVADVRDDEKNDMVFNYSFVDADSPRAPKTCQQRILEAANIDMLKTLVAKTHGVNKIELYVCQVRKNKIHHLLGEHEVVTDINQKLDVFIYRFAQCYLDPLRFPISAFRNFRLYTSGYVRRFVALSHMHGHRKGRQYTAMGYPLLMMLPLPNDMMATMRQVRVLLCTTVRHFLKDKSLKTTDGLPYRLWAQWGHHNSLEIVDSDIKFAMNKRNLNFCVHWSDVEQFETVSKHNSVADPTVQIQLPTYTRESLQALDKEDIIDAMLRLQMAVSARNGRRMVECPHCFISVADEDLSDHNAICLKAPKPCALCGTMVVRKHETDHWRTECTAYKFDCVECGITLSRDQRRVHHAMHHREVYSRPEIPRRVSDPKPARWPRAYNTKPTPVAPMPATLVPPIVSTETTSLPAAPLPAAPLPGGPLLPAPPMAPISGAVLPSPPIINLGQKLKAKVKELAQHNPNLLRALQQTPRKIYAVLRDPYIKHRLAHMMGLVYQGYEPRVNVFEDLRRIENATVYLIYGFCRESAREAGLRPFSEWIVDVCVLAYWVKGGFDAKCMRLMESVCE